MHIQNTKWRLFVLMGLSTLFCCLLILYRSSKIDIDLLAINSLSELQRTGKQTFLFLIWNLFLAWIPYWIALLSNFMARKNGHSIFLISGFAFWLLFFPNAPYIITDLLHLRYRDPIPMWYDLLLIFSFAWTGLLLAYLSLFEIKQMLELRLSNLKTQIVIFLSLALSSFGIFVGRFQWWNSWDIFSRPLPLIQDMLDVLLHPMAHIRTFGLAVVLFGFLSLAYLTLINLRHLETTQK